MTFQVQTPNGGSDFLGFQNFSGTNIAKITAADASANALTITTGNSGTTAAMFDTNQNATMNYISAQNTFGFKNRIINGAMVIDQRNAGASITANNGAFPVDRFRMDCTQSSKGNCQQTPSATETGYATRIAAGFTNYFAFTSTSAYSVLSSDEFTITQNIEGYNVSDLAWGTSSAKTVTLSFWVYSSLTGTFGGAVANNASNRSYPFSYTISAANTWTQVSVTIPGDTSGTWLTTNGIGIRVWFSLGAGSTYSGTAGAWVGSDNRTVTGAVSVVGTNGATFYITGVQLEKGSIATPFDYRDYGRELAMCQRYGLQMAVSGYDNYQYYAIGYLYNTTQGTYTTYLPVPMRTTPTITQSGTLTASNLGINISSLAAPTSQIGAILTADFTLVSTTTSGNAAFIRWANQSTKSLFLSAEL